MKHLRMILIPIIVLSLNVFVTAQSLKDRMEKMQLSFKDASSVHLAMSISVFLNKQADQPFFRQEADVQRSGDLYRYNLGGLDMMMNEEYTVMVDRTQKQIVYSMRSVEDQKKFQDPLKLNLDSILTLYQNAAFKLEDDGRERYSLKQENREIEQIDFLIFPSAPWLDELQYHYQDGHFVVIKFISFETDVNFPADTFSTNQYIVVDKASAKPSAMFKGFLVVEAKAESTLKNKIKSK